MVTGLLQPLHKMQNAIQLAAFHYIASLKTVPTNADYTLTFDGKVYSFNGIQTADSQQLHADFQNWATVSVLRDLIENFSIFLMEVYEQAVTSNPEGYFSSTPAKFEQRGIEDQLNILAKDFGADVAWISRLTGYNRARNCLAHRAGIIGAKDVTDGDELVIRWLISSLEVHEHPVTPIIEVQGPMGNLIQGNHIAGKGARVSILDREKRVSVGNTLRFFPDEMLEICLTFQLASVAISGLSQPLVTKPLQ